MATTHIYLKNLHFDQQLWTNELKFYKEELALLGKHLAEVVGKNSSQEVLATAERFQNQFIRQNEVIDETQHEINVRRDALVVFAQNNATAIDHQYFDDKKTEHEALRDTVATFKKIYAEMKSEFMQFLAKWM